MISTILNRWRFRTWPRPIPPDLSLDLLHGRLGPIDLGAHFPPPFRLGLVLGPPASWHFMRRGFWMYPQWGLLVDMENDRVMGFAVVLRHPERSWFGIARMARRVRPFAFPIHLPGERVTPPHLTATRVRLRWGDPSFETELGDDLVWEYTEPHHTVVFRVDRTTEAIVLIGCHVAAPSFR